MSRLLLLLDPERFVETKYPGLGVEEVIPVDLSHRLDDRYNNINNTIRRAPAELEAPLAEPDPVVEGYYLQRVWRRP